MRTQRCDLWIGGLIAALGIMLVAAAITCSMSFGASPDSIDRVEEVGASVCPPRGLTIDGTVVRVIDGDTIVVESRVQYHLRLLDCWAPESRTTDAQEKKRGLASKARMTELATWKNVRVHLPSGGGDITDMITLGRVLGRCWLVTDDRPGNEDLSAIMVREQLATREKLKP